MMKKTVHNLNLLIIIILTLFTSCKTEVEFDGDMTAQLPVMNAVVCDGDTTLSVSLTKSKFFLNRHSFETIDDATVVLSCNGAQFSLSHSGKGTYTLVRDFCHGDRVSISAQIPSFSTTLGTGTLEIPRKPEITAAEIIYNNDSSKYIHLRFLNPADEENFFQIRIYKNGNASGMYLYCYDECTINMNSNYASNNYGSRIMFPDTKLSDTCDVNLYFIEFGDDDDGLKTETDSYTVVLESLNSDLYRYCRNIANASSDGGGGSSFTEPVQVHSNIKNGLGIFGTKAVCKTTVTG